MILCIMRIGRRVRNRIEDNRGISLVELIVVISIMAVMVGVTSLGLGMMFSRDANYVAVRIDDALSETRTLSMSKDGKFTCLLHIDAPDGSYVQINRSVGGAVSTEYKKILLDKSVNIAVKGDGTAISGDFSVEFDKSKGSVKQVNGATADKGVYTITVTSTKNTSKTRDVTLVTITGRHYTDK